MERRAGEILLKFVERRGKEEKVCVAAFYTCFKRECGRDAAGSRLVPLSP